MNLSKTLDPAMSEVAADAGEPPSGDKLDQLRAAVRMLRDLDREITDAEERLSGLKTRKYDMMFSTLPELFDTAGVDRVGLPAEGNLPSYDAVVEPYYKAGISADWPAERQAEGFATLEALDAGDLIKTEVVVRLGRGDRDQVERLRQLMSTNGYSFDEKMAVQWNTLTAWVREQHQKGRTPPLGPLGATIGRVLKLKERK